MNQNHLNKILFLCGISLSTTAFSFDYFDKKFDYFSESVSRPDATKKERPSEVKPKKKFDWNKTLDPMDESMEFFKEGEHMPPRPYIEMFRNPNDENIKNWFKLMKKKNELSQKLGAKIREYLRKNPGAANVSEFRELSVPREAATNVDPARYRLRLYFHSKCTHCQKMLTTMKHLAARGFYVEVRQIDNNEAARANIPFPVRKASEQELKDKQIASWPVLLAADLKSKKIYQINGYQPSNRVLETLSGK